jgi:Arc/MetJ-type ribon-helix-helix transcriptional regulator
MTSIVLPADIEAWAREEVAAGRAESISAFIAKALREIRALGEGHRSAVEQAYTSMASGAVVDEVVADAELDRWIAEDGAAGR